MGPDWQTVGRGNAALILMTASWLFGTPALADFPTGIGGATVTLSPPQAPYPCTTNTCNYSATTYSSARYDGNQTGGAAGTAAINADFNGDGWLDLAIGAPRADVNKGQGKVYVVYGSASAPSTTVALGGANVVSFGGQGAGDNFGASLAACDLTGDGLEDLVVGAPNAGSLESGQVYVVPGTGSGVKWTSVTDVSNFVGLIALSGSVQDSSTGLAIACGDLSGDGAADLVVGAPGASTVYIVYGPVASGVLTDGGVSSTLLTLLGVPDDGTGSAVSIPGDLEGDGLRELVIGAPQAWSGAGMLWILGGGSLLEQTSPIALNTSPLTPSRVIQGNLAFDGVPAGEVGASVRGAGDVDSDGYDDLLIGAPSAPRSSSSRKEAGRVYIVFGGANFFETEATPTSSLTTFFFGESEYDRLGTTLAAAGDVEGDGYHDLLVGAVGADLTDSGQSQQYGASYLLAGRQRESWAFPTGGTGLPIFYSGDTRNIRFMGRSAGDRAGSLLNGAPGLDIDGDSFDDFFIGAPGVDVSSVASDSSEGRVYLLSFGDFMDRDQDSQSRALGDCNDKNPAMRYVSSGATEVCDSGLDNDCDGLSDDQDDPVAGQKLYYPDQDGDGYGNAAVPTSLCAGTPPSGYVTDGSDCYDGNSAVHPGAREVCDVQNSDEDCDGARDDADSNVDPSTQSYFYPDGDGDGSGEMGSPGTVACDAPVGGTWSTDALDCNDLDDTIGPDEQEVCGGGDEDCDGKIDDSDTDVLDQILYYQDVDEDGYGGGDPLASCALVPPSGYSIKAGDCSDTDPGRNPGATEQCDLLEVDEDCDGFADDSDPEAPVSGAQLYFPDSDQDGYGDSSSPGSFFCDEPSSSNSYWTTDNSDCNDADPAIQPGAAEVCDGNNVDEDCDGLADDKDPGGVADGLIRYRPDADRDGYGDQDSSGLLSCDPPSTGSYVADDQDCDDSEALVHPGALEICNGVDDDCDGKLDGEDASLSGDTVVFLDRDGDGHGDPESPLTSCSAFPPDGTTSQSAANDCIDSDASVHPGAAEGVVDPSHGNCMVEDGIDNDCDGLIDEGTCSTDSDGDGWSAELDCQDSNASINPGATELCDQVDQDCDGNAINGFDEDRDGYLNAEACGVAGEDCDDSRAEVHAGAPELCNGLDDNCDGLIQDEGIESELDLDEDGVRPCEGDCDDLNPNSAAGAIEVCDGIDNNCDGQTDLDAPDAMTVYTDADGDGHGNNESARVVCVKGPTDVLAGDDCDDQEPAAFPGADEVCDGIDNDCDGAGDPRGTFDADGDGFLDANQCSALGEPLLLDCDDQNGAVHPDATEIAGDAIDNNCDGRLSEQSTVRDDALGCAYTGHGSGTLSFVPTLLAALAVGATRLRRRGQQVAVAASKAFNAPPSMTNLLEPLLISSRV